MKFYLIECPECDKQFISGDDQLYCPKHGYCDVIDTIDWDPEIEKRFEEIEERLNKIEGGKSKSDIVKETSKYIQYESGVYECKKCGKKTENPNEMWGHLNSH